MKKRKFITSTLVALFGITSLNFVGRNSKSTSIKNEIIENVTNNNNLLAHNVNIQKNRPIEGASFEDRPSKKIDYSGIGTNITNKVNTSYCASEKYKAYKTGSMLSIPVYKGKYNKSKPSKTGSWSSWSTIAPTNYIYNENKYIGDTIQENEIQLKTEYRYYQVRKRKKYKTKYVTWFRGNKWWNRLITFFETSDYGYSSPSTNFNVISKYSYSVEDGEIEYNEYDYTWRDKAPFGSNYHTFDSRTVYRSRTKTYKWDSFAEKTREKVPLYHSLYHRDGSPIKNGIMLESNHDISIQYRHNNGEKTYNYDTKCFYIPTKVLEETIIENIKSCSDNDESIEAAQIAAEIFQLSLPEIVSFIVSKIGEQGLFKSLIKAGPLTAIMLACFNIKNILLHKEKEIAAENFKNIFTQIDKYNLLSVSFSKFFSIGDGGYSFSPVYYLDTNLVDKKDDPNDDLNYISMDFFENKNADKDNFIPYKIFDGCNSYYGNIKYEDSFEDFYQVIRTYFASYDIYNIESWFNNLF